MASSSPATRFLGYDPDFPRFRDVIEAREMHLCRLRSAFLGPHQSVLDAAAWHLEHGLHRKQDGWLFREWLPNATRAWLIGDFSGWKREARFELHRAEEGNFQGIFGPDEILPGQKYRMHVEWPGGCGDRIPAEATIVRRNTQDISRGDVLFDAVVPEWKHSFQWRHARPRVPAHPLVYEAHPGMAGENPGICTFNDFRQMLPAIRGAGYNTLQLMGIMQHPYYASFGYHVSNFFAVTDLLGTPDDFKQLVDDAHALGLCVVIDLIHSHAACNEIEGLSRIDGTETAFFHEGERGHHPAWGSRCFNYSRPEVLRFLASNCRFWLEEYRIDGFRFDGITSMLYFGHGLGRGTWRYEDYFGPDADWDAFAYLCIAHEVIRAVLPEAITIAEDVSGFPGLTLPRQEGGCGFSLRLAMGMTDYWFKLTDIPDDAWPLGTLWHEMTGKRSEERCLGYVECHDQALVGGKTFFFTLAGAEVYTSMSVFTQSLAIDRAMALHKMARLMTLAASDAGYLNFMGNEFGHPEWIDFPTERNGWSFQYARRQWHLREDQTLKYHFLADFDRDMLALTRQFPDFFEKPPQLIHIDETRKIIAFYRGRRLFAFNFHPDASCKDYPLPCFPALHHLVLDTDRAEYGGFSRIQEKQEFFPIPVMEGSNRNHYLRLYLPARTAMVLSFYLKP